ncbi:MAG: MoxR family ATPase [Firmicutes bacterium]|nr:MoxR family ATPase [Bacillota bacterium]
MEISDINIITEKIKKNIQKVIVGKDEVVDLMMVSIICSGHILLEDVPGLGKTMIANSLAKSVDSNFKRIQFTPDLLPSDLTGIYYYNQKSGQFQFKKGPIISQIILADEINRATPRTQSSLLEVMQEHQVTVDGITHFLEEPFFVIATQNPVETTGTFPLPEAQLDRFLMKISMGYPKLEEELKILERFKDINPITQIKPVVSTKDIINLRKTFKNVYVNDDIKRYIIDIARSTREHKDIELGISPRGSLALFKSSQAYAAIKGRDYVIPDDIKYLVKPILRHRIKLNSNVLVKGKSVDDILEQILFNITTPVEEKIERFN